MWIMCTLVWYVQQPHLLFAGRPRHNELPVYGSVPTYRQLDCVDVWRWVLFLSVRRFCPVHAAMLIVMLIVVIPVKCTVHADAYHSLLGAFQGPAAP